MEKEKKELLMAGIKNYVKQDIDNPMLCVEAIGFLKACKIVIPEKACAFDELIGNFNFLGFILTLSE